MRKCNKCNIEFNGHIDTCPICHNSLCGKKTDSVFPRNIKQKTDKMLFKLLSFVTVAIGISSIFLEYKLTNNLSFRLYIIVGLITNFVLIRFILNKYQKPLKMMTKYFMAILILLIIWFLLTENLTLTTYIIPIICLIVFTFNSVTICVFKSKYVAAYTLFILFDIIVGIIPVIFVLAGLTTTNILAEICLILDLIFLIGLLIFCKDEIIHEIKKLFSV